MRILVLAALQAATAALDGDFECTARFFMHISKSAGTTINVWLNRSSLLSNTIVRHRPWPWCCNGSGSHSASWVSTHLHQSSRVFTYEMTLLRLLELASAARRPLPRGLCVWTVLREPMAWLESLHDPLFGYCDMVRFSWAPTKACLLESGREVVFEADLDDDEQEDSRQRKGTCFLEVSWRRLGFHLKSFCTFSNMLCMFFRFILKYVNMS